MVEERKEREETEKRFREADIVDELDEILISRMYPQPALVDDKYAEPEEAPKSSPKKPLKTSKHNTTKKKEDSGSDSSPWDDEPAPGIIREKDQNRIKEKRRRAGS